MNQSILIDDISKLDDGIQEQKNIKDSITWYINPKGTFKEFGEYECDKDYGIFDKGGYLMQNILHDIFGFPKTPFTVEHQVPVRCDI